MNKSDASTILPPRTHCRPRAGQALFELAIGLIVFVALILSAITFAQLSLKQLRMRRDVRLEAGTAALTRSTEGWVDEETSESSTASTFAKINAINDLSAVELPFASTLSSSAYTLAARNLAVGELGLQTSSRSEIVPLDEVFMKLIYSKGNVRFSETLTFPATSGLWP